MASDEYAAELQRAFGGTPQDEPTWVEIIPGRHWSSWQSAYHRGLVLGGSGVTFIGTLATGHVVARTYTGQEWLLVGAS